MNSMRSGWVECTVQILRIEMDSGKKRFRCLLVEDCYARSVFPERTSEKTDCPGWYDSERGKKIEKREQQTKQKSNLKSNLSFSGGIGKKLPHVQTNSLTNCANYPNTTVCMLMHTDRLLH